MKKMNKTAIVTGAGTGVGRAVAHSLIEAGYQVTLVGRRAEPLEETAELSVDKARTLIVQADVSDESAVENVFARTVEKFGRLDLVFNNAGIGARPVEMHELEVDEWRAVVDINLTGVFLCTRQAFRIMKEQSPQGGRIINNGSISAHTPRPFSAPYTSTKHAVTGLTKSTSLDGRKYNIACGQIDIGNAATPMTDRMVAGDGVPQATGELAQEARMDARHVGEAVVYMDSLPLEANVLTMTVMANHMPFVGRG